MSLRELVALRDKVNSSIARYQRIRRYVTDCPEPTDFDGFVEASCALDTLDRDLERAQADAEAAAIRRNREGR